MRGECLERATFWMQNQRFSWQAFAAEQIVVVHSPAAIKVVRWGCMKKLFLGGRLQHHFRPEAVL